MGKGTTRLARFTRWWGRYIWPVARHLVIPILCVIVLYIGLVLGYVYFGDKPMADVGKWETWKHLYDLIFSDG